jgi:hypothetical protein
MHKLEVQGDGAWEHASQFTSERCSFERISSQRGGSPMPSALAARNVDALANQLPVPRPERRWREALAFERLFEQLSPRVASALAAQATTRTS